MTQHQGDIIQEAREREGLDVGECGQEVGLSSFCMSDVETDATEFFDNISLGTARRICELLHLDFLDLVATFYPVEISERAPLSNAEFFSRDRVISERRRVKGLSEDALGDAIGFESVTVSMLEHTPDFIESLPVHAVVDVAKAIGIDPGKLLGGNRTKS